MSKWALFKVVNWVATVVLVVCFVLALNGGQEIAMFNLDLTDVPRLVFVIVGFVAAVVSIAADYFCKVINTTGK